MSETLTSDAPNAISVFVNGRTITTRARRLSDLVAEQGLGAAKVATAVNGDFVPAGRRATTELDDGDRIEIVSARQGG